MPFVVWIPSSNREFVGLIVPEILWCKIFGVLAWNCLFTPLFWEFLGNIFPIWRHPSSWPPKGTSLGGNTSFEPFSVTNSATVRPGGRIEKKNCITKKSKSVSVVFTTVTYFNCYTHACVWRSVNKASLIYLFTCLFVATASNVKATGLFEPREQLYVLKLDRSQCEKLLSVNGKQRQYVIRESRKVIQP